MVYSSDIFAQGNQIMRTCFRPMMNSKKQIHGGELRESRFFWQQNIETYIKLRVEGVKVLFAKKDKNLYQTNCNCSGFRNRDYNDNWSANNRLLDNRLVSSAYKRY